MAAQDARSDGADASLALKNEGNAALARGRYAEAISCYSRAIELELDFSKMEAHVTWQFEYGANASAPLATREAAATFNTRTKHSKCHRRRQGPGHVEEEGGPGGCRLAQRRGAGGG